MSSAGYHLPIDELPTQTGDMHGAIVTQMESLVIVDGHNQRIDAYSAAERRPYLSPGKSNPYTPA